MEAPKPKPHEGPGRTTDVPRPVAASQLVA
jgi:hypothetical protein